MILKTHLLDETNSLFWIFLCLLFDQTHLSILLPLLQISGERKIVTLTSCPLFALTLCICILQLSFGIFRICDCLHDKEGFVCIKNFYLQRYASTNLHLCIKHSLRCIIFCICICNFASFPILFFWFLASSTHSDPDFSLACWGSRLFQHPLLFISSVMLMSAWRY